MTIICVEFECNDAYIGNGKMILVPPTIIFELQQ